LPASFVPPRPIRALRDLDQARLASATDILGKVRRAMLDALVSSTTGL
jgi:hypothetical protein